MMNYMNNFSPSIQPMMPICLMTWLHVK